ncbi:hypothetical protein [Streptomyces murinus]|uniref:hypothetical protein n=1 Tax=Streptomyces murinus TaxID=33900 RepID=UPI00381FA0D9
MTSRLRTAHHTLLTPLARALALLTDHVARRCDVPNPVAAVRGILVHVADQNLSGADVYMERSPTCSPASATPGPQAGATPATPP